MIPVGSIREYQHGNIGNGAVPKINLGSSLARKGEEASEDITKLATPRKSVVAGIQKVIIGRRVSGAFASLTNFQENGAGDEKRSSGPKSPSSGRRATVMGRDDLRIKRLRLKDMGIDRRRSLRVPNKPSARKFYKIARVVRIVVRLNMALRKYLTEESNADWSLLEMKLNVESYFDRKLSFRPVDRWTSPSFNGRLATVLTVPPRLRSQEHIKTIKALLRGHAAFEDYPDHVQNQLCQSMIYQRYEARRMIIRLGHEPKAFYLILSGKLLVNIRETSTRGVSFMRTVNQLGHGEAFGEVALITGNKRNATIVCKTDAEVLLIEKEDFDKLIRNPLETERESHLNYIKRMELFKHFPCDVLEEDSHEFFYQYFKPNHLILANSVASDYLVVVRSGKCQAVVAYNPDAGVTKRDKEKEKQLEATFPLYSTKLKQEKTDNLRRDVADIENTLAIEFAISAKSGVKINPKVQQFNQRFPEINGPRKAAGRRRSSSMNGFFDLMEAKKKSSGKLMPDFWSKTLRTQTPLAKQMKDIDENQTEDKSISPYKDSKLRRLSMRHRVTPQDSSKITATKVNRWKRMAALASASKMKERSTKVQFNIDLKYAQLAEFDEGKVFGLETLLHKDTHSSISLLSQGAECLFISKKLFLEHANAKVLRTVSDLVVTYPSQEFIGTYIRRQRKWKEYKSTLIHHCTAKGHRLLKDK